MSYKAFTEFLNYSREAKELLGTSPLLKDQTGDRLQTNGSYREPGDRLRIRNENGKVLQVSSPDINGVDVSNSKASYMKTSYNMDNQQNGPSSWATCSKTLQSLLEQYITETSSFSSLKQVLLDKNNSQVNDSDVIEETQEPVTSQVPPPLLHRPTKRSLEQSHVAITSPDSKRSRLENYYTYAEQNHVRMPNETSHAREEMFEKTRSFGNPSKAPIGPPPPLLKQPEVDKNEQEFTQRGSSQVHYTKEAYRDPVEWRTTRNNGGCKNNTTSLNNVTRNTTTPGQHSQQTGSSPSFKLPSPSSNGKRELLIPEPQPRQIEGDDKSSCGGYAFDHTAMPKIVAVHSVSRGSKDDDEWERNKAFISKAKAANQNNSSHNAVPEEQRGQKMSERSHWQSRSVSVQNQRSSTQDIPNRQKPETNQSTFASNGKKSTSEEVSFERYVLYHLLSRFQGNVEQVKRVLKQNLLQEWLAYSHGNVDPRQQTFEGVNFYELRKLYEIWRQLHRSKRTNEAQSTSSQMISNSQNSEPNRVKTASDSHFPQQMCFRNSQSSPNSQYPKVTSRLQGNCSQNVSNLNQAVPQTFANGTPGVPSNSQRVYGGVFKGATRSASNNNLPMHIQEKMYSRSQNSAHGTINPNRTPASAVFRNQHNINSPQSSIHSHSSTNQLAALNGNQATLTLRSDMGGKHTNIPHMPVDHVKTNHIRQTQGNVLRSQYEPFGRSSQRNVLEQERMNDANISPAAILQHFPQTTSKPTQNQSSSSTVFRNSTPVSSYGESVQGQRHPLEQAARSNDAIRGQETAKASYLWRFKGGKLISDNMPSINIGEPVTEIELTGLISGQRKNTEVKVSMEAKREVHTSGQQSYHKMSASMSLSPNDQSCKSQTSQHVISEADHKKVCGAAASGQRCYCILRPKSCPQSACAQKANNPIQSIQQMINRTNSPVREHTTLPIQAQSSNIKIQTDRSVFNTHNTQVYQRSNSVRISLNAQANQQFNASVGISSNEPTSQQSNASFYASSKARVSEGEQQSNATINITRNAQEIQQSNMNLHVSSAAQTIQQSNASFYASSNARVSQEDQQPNATINITRNGQENQQFNASASVSPNGPTSQQSNASFYASSNARVSQGDQQSNTTINMTRTGQETQQFNASASVLPNGPTRQQSNASFYASSNARVSQQSVSQGNQQSNAQGTQQSNANLHVTSAAQASQQSNKIFYVSRKPQANQQFNANANTQANQQSSTSLHVPSTAQTSQSKHSFHVSRNAQENQQCDSNLNALRNAQVHQRSNAALHVSRNAKESRQSNANFHVSPNAQVNQQTNPSFPHVSCNAQENQQCNSNLNISRNAQIHQQSNAALYVSGHAKESHVLSNTQTNQQANSRVHVQVIQQPTANLDIAHSAQVDQQSNATLKTSRNAQVTQQPKASLDISRNAQVNQQSNTSFKLPRAAQAKQQSSGSFKIPRNARSKQQSNEAIVNKSQISKMTVVPKVETNTSCQKETPKKTETSIAIKSERTSDKQCSFLTSLPPKKQYTSLQQLAKKIIETRQRFEMENIPWKKKILKSLEGVLMKRLRKIERETGEEAELDDVKSSEPEANTTEQENKK